jgi:polyhydroxybutyrate depolymerase
MSRTCSFLASLLLAATVLACGDSDGAVAVDAGPADAAADTSPIGGDRPTMVAVPGSYDAAKPTPLVVVLHGYFSFPEYIGSFFKLGALAEDQHVLVVSPAGNANPDGNYFWNATDACCDLFGAKPDDDAYLTHVVEQIKARYNVDPKRVFLIGHSNGAFMALRMACNHADVFAAAISIAGAQVASADACKPSQPVSVLQIHGDADDTIAYEGGVLRQHDGTAVAYPSAAATVAAWAKLDGCGDATEPEAAIDLDGNGSAETTRVKHVTCPAGLDTELWTVPKGSHYYVYGDNATLWTWLAAHPKR